ncbi:MAG: PLP-dependent aspartate aminotransferase family protein [Candidatus Bipolaricaulia bacterium]
MSARFATRAIHVGSEPDAQTGAVIPPIYATSTYRQSAPGQHQGYDYSRADNPTRERFEQAVASLEGAEHAVAFASGIAATSAVVTLLNPGDGVISGNDLYGGTYRLFEQHFRRYGIPFAYVDTTDPANVRPDADTRLIWVETPTNPLMDVTDIRAVAERKADAWLAVDNTFSSPYLQRPHELGADLVVHSATKYLGGHSDLIGGVVTTSDPELRDRLKFIQLSIGAVPSPFDCFLAHRGVKTLAARMRSHCENARRVADFLQDHPRVTRLLYPGLPSHPGHEVASRQMDDFGGMLSFELDGDPSAFLRNLDVFALAESLGGIESLINHPATMTHASIPREQREARGISDGLFRLSVGIEHADDLTDDLDRALQAG